MDCLYKKKGVFHLRDVLFLPLLSNNNLNGVLFLMNAVKFLIENVGFYRSTKVLLTGLYMERSHLQNNWNILQIIKKILQKDFCVLIGF